MIQHQIPSLRPPGRVLRYGSTPEWGRGLRGAGDRGSSAVVASAGGMVLGLRRSGRWRVMGLLLSAQPRGVLGRSSPSEALPTEAGRGDPRPYSPVL